jgi:hypothetical protein
MSLEGDSRCDREVPAPQRLHGPLRHPPPLGRPCRIPPHDSAPRSRHVLGTHSMPCVPLPALLCAHVALCLERSHALVPRCIFQQCPSAFSPQAVHGRQVAAPPHTPLWLIIVAAVTAVYLATTCLAAAFRVHHNHKGHIGRPF